MSRSSSSAANTARAWPVLLAGLGVWIAVAAAASPARAASPTSPLTTDIMIVILRPERPTDRDYLTYVSALLDTGQLPHPMVEGTLLWARQKPEHKFQYFKQALITRAEAVSIHLPQDCPPLTGVIDGKVVYLINLGLVKVDVPLANASVRIMGTDRTTTSNAKGEFTFRGAPFGRHTVYARGKAALVLTKSGSVRVTLPTKPPSDTSARAYIVAH